MVQKRGIDDSSAYLEPPPAGAPDAWTQSAAQSGQVGTNQLLEVAEIAAPEPVATALALGPGEGVVVRRRLALLDDRPVELADSYYPAWIAAGSPLAESRKIRGGAPRALADLGYRAAYADEELELDSAATPEEAALLAVPVGERLVRMFRVAFAASGSPFEVSISAMLPAGRTLRHRITIS